MGSYPGAIVLEKAVNKCVLSAHYHGPYKLHDMLFVLVFLKKYIENVTIARKSCRFQDNNF